MKRSTPYKRKKSGKTNYKKRLTLLLSHKARIVIRKSNKNIQAHLVQYHENGDRTIACSHSRQLTKYGWKNSRSNTPAAYLVGYLLGCKAAKKKIKEAVADLGLYQSTKGNKLYAVIRGASDAGLNVPHSEECIPSKDRIAGKHMESYQKKQIEQDFEKVKEQIKNDR
ncbi:MAG: 50S ribosomal protein L18 [Candidatus Woesearchaeota archaeon]